MMGEGSKGHTLSACLCVLAHPRLAPLALS